MQPEVKPNVAVMGKLRAAEIAKYLGVTRERVRQIAATDPSFPQPVETEPHRRWDRAEVERWAERHFWGTYLWRRRPGREPGLSRNLRLRPTLTIDAPRQKEENDADSDPGHENGDAKPYPVVGLMPARKELGRG